MKYTKFFILVVVAVFLFLVVRLIAVATSRGRFASYWQNEAKKPIEQNSLIYMALGDSLSQGIGATSPAKGMIGILAKRIANKTNRPVHVINVSKSGARIKDVLDNQLPELQALQQKPQIVTVDIGGNDMKFFNKEKFEEEYTALAASLPEGTILLEISPYFKEKAVIANQLINKIAKNYNLKVARIENLSYKLRFEFLDYGGDFFHPSNRGYKKWADVLWVEVQQSLSQ